MMKAIFLFLCTFLITGQYLRSDKDISTTWMNAEKSIESFSSCSFNGIELKGKVKIVDNFADIKIQYVDHFPDIKVKFVDNFPDDCGEWKIVDNFPDFTVEIVDHFPDLKVKKVDHFPGMD